MIKVLNALLAIVGGVAGRAVLYYVLNKLAELLPGKWEDRVKPYLFVLPALAAIGLFLIYPRSRRSCSASPTPDSTEFVGLNNYTNLLSPMTSRTRCSTRCSGSSSCPRPPSRSAC